jgi:3D-(3,5/4)-trihydroxycyclohexane-1,2-dione acylhydrolase (decyclizing)
MIAGGGVRYAGAQAELGELADRLGVPVCETSAGKGVTPGGDLLLGGVGVNGTRAANEIARDADLVLCVGTRLTDFTTGSHSLFADPDVRFVGLNVGSMDAYKLGAAPVVADAKLALAALTERLASAGWTTSDAYRATVRARMRAWREELEADLRPRPGERLTQGQALRVLNQVARPGDVVVGAAGSTPGDLLKLWDCTGATSAHIEFGFSCMGHELPAGIGYRLALGDDTREIMVVIGDGTYLMANTELATAVQERLKVTLVLVVNGGYQSIHTLQRSTTGESFGNEFRHRGADDRLSGEPVGIDYAANVRSLGCMALEARDAGELRDALTIARDAEGPVAVVVHVEPRRGMLHTGTWWDLGVAEVSVRREVREIAAARAADARAQRFYY